MVAEMNRLEQAARVSMGGYQDTETQLSSRPSHLPFRPRRGCAACRRGAGGGVAVDLEQFQEKCVNGFPSGIA